MKQLKYISLAIVSLILLSCSEDGSGTSLPVADFDYTTVDGSGLVTFTNKSINADVYAWEFGDNLNKSSEESDPTFEYGIPGTYTVEVTLYAGNGRTGDNHFVTKSIQLTDVPAQVYIEFDGATDDWEYVDYVADIEGVGEFTKMKVWGADDDYIYFLLEGTEYLKDLASNCPGVFLDVDNNASTGYLNTEWCPFIIGIDTFCDGSANWGANFTGGDMTNDWSFDWFNESSWINISDRIEVDSSTSAYEIQISKSVLNSISSKTLSSTGINVGFTDKGDSYIPNSEPVFVSFTK